MAEATEDGRYTDGRHSALPADRVDVPRRIGITALRVCARGMGRSAFSAGLVETVSHNLRVDWRIHSGGVGALLNESTRRFVA